MTLVVGTLRIDVGLPPNVSIANFIDDVIDIANDQISAHPELAGSQFDTAEDKWTLGRLGADPIDPSRSLAEANVSDGELLSIREIGEPFSPLLFDDVEDVEVAPDRANVAWMTWFVDNQRMIGYLVTGLAVATAAALLLPSHAGDLVLAGTTLGLGVFGVIVACVLALRSGGTTRPQWVSVVATPLLFGGPLYVIPEGFGAKALPMAFGLTALSSLVMLLITGNGRALHTTVITLSALGGASTSAQLLWHLPQRTIGAAVATLAVVVIYVSPRVTIALSKLPIPRVPTAGEPLDDIETQGGTTVEGVNAIGKQIIPTEEGMIGRLRRANAYLTGMLVAAAITAAVGCYLCVGGAGGFYWQGTAFSVAVATVLCLRGRQPPRPHPVRHADRGRTRHRLDDDRQQRTAGARRAGRRRAGAGRPYRADHRLRHRRAATGVLAGDAPPGRAPGVSRHRDGLPAVFLDCAPLRVLPGTADLTGYFLGGSTFTPVGSAGRASCATSAAS
ncbi:type VII secretion integral membrane protein EccD [Mycolicibacterium insubricum]|uniref:type VII secretion integral membrane protein EccD n=1 Tax=Mycolicibacterium insubricum TaxID=444597 RepID=UPI0039089F29